MPNEVKQRISRHLVLRPLFSVFTLLCVGLAVIQASGRLSTAVLHLFETNINSVLASQQIVVQGLQGGWHGFNPVIQVARLQLPAGEVTDADIEVDLLESLLRGTLVPRRVVLQQVSLKVDQTADGWRLRGMGAQASPIDLQAVLNGPLRHVDNLHAVVLVNFNGGEQHAQLGARVGLVNRGGRHYVDASLSNTAVLGEALHLEGWQQEALPWVTEAVNTGTVKGRLQVPQLLTNMPGLQLSGVEGVWHDLSETGGGRLQLEVSGLQVAQGGEPLAARLVLSGQRRQDSFDGLVEQFRVYTAANSLSLGNAHLSLQLDAEDSEFAAARQLLSGAPKVPRIRLWLEQLSLTELSSFMRATVSHWEPVGRWVEGLAVAGSASNIHGYYDAAAGLGYRASIADLHMRGYKGAPTLENGQGVLWGYQRGIAMQLNAADVGLQFPDLFHQKWRMDTISGVVKGWFARGYFALRGSHLKARMGETAIAGAFSLSRPNPRYEQRVGLSLHVDRVGLLPAKAYIPYKIPAQLAEWLDIGPRDGRLSDARFVYHGQVHQQPGIPARRIELTANLHQGSVAYDPAWPLVTGLNAVVHVAGSSTRVKVAQGTTLGVRVDGSRATVLDNGRLADVVLQAKGDGADVLEFVRGSPLQQQLNFITPQWRSSGGMQFNGSLRVPLREDDNNEPLDVQLQLELADAELVMPEYRSELRGLSGNGRFRLPHHLSGEFSGEMFAQPVQVRISSDDQWLWFDMAGRAAPADVYQLIDYTDGAPLQGYFDFDGRLNVAVGGGVTNLQMTSNLLGLQVGLPAEFGKTAEDEAAIEIGVQFLEEYQSVRWQYASSNGWLHVGDTIERGAIGINQAPPMTAQEESAMLISGSMPQIVLSDWVTGEGESSVALPVDWTIRNLAVGRLVIDELDFEDITLNGNQRGEQAAFQFDGETLRGAVTIPENEPLDIDLAYLRLPVSAADVQPVADGDAEDPLSVEVGRALPHARVNIEQLDLGDDPFGAWNFVMEPVADTVVLSPFTAHVKGVHIEDSTIIWDLPANRSAFVGELTLDDLQTTLPQWDYAASLQTATADMTADAAWAGSPANVSLLGLTGQLTLDAADGRFLEVEGTQGGLRILSLINFSKIAKRISFDFSDVVGSGISFDQISANVSLQAGRLSFNEPMMVDSSSGLYQVGGQVDLGTGALDNEMIVTLPVSNSLPWYGVYLALANPLAGIGVVVGERIFRKPIKQFSTAKFEVSGTLEDPKVEFVSLWDRSMKAPEENGKSALADKSDAPPPA